MKNRFDDENTKLDLDDIFKRDSFKIEKPKGASDYIILFIAVFFPYFFLLCNGCSLFVSNRLVLGCHFWTIGYGSFVVYRLWKIDENFREFVLKIKNKVFGSK